MSGHTLPCDTWDRWTAHCVKVSVDRPRILFLTLNVTQVIRQSNGYDCGVWVIAQIMALMRGREATGLVEQDIEAVRRWIYHNLVTLPLKESQPR